MEKPRKFYCKRHDMNSDRKNCRDCDVFYMSNLTVDAMSTWLEGEVPTVEEIEKVLDETIESCCLKFKGAKAIHALITRKLTGKV